MHRHQRRTSRSDRQRSASPSPRKRSKSPISRTSNSQRGLQHQLSQTIRPFSTTTINSNNNNDTVLSIPNNHHNSKHAKKVKSRFGTDNPRPTNRRLRVPHNPHTTTKIGSGYHFNRLRRSTVPFNYQHPLGNPTILPTHRQHAHSPMHVYNPLTLDKLPDFGSEDDELYVDDTASQSMENITFTEALKFTFKAKLKGIKNRINVKRRKLAQDGDLHDPEPEKIELTESYVQQRKAQYDRHKKRIPKILQNSLFAHHGAKLQTADAPTVTSRSNISTLLSLQQEQLFYQFVTNNIIVDIFTKTDHPIDPTPTPPNSLPRIPYKIGFRWSNASSFIETNKTLSTGGMAKLLQKWSHYQPDIPRFDDYQTAAIQTLIHYNSWIADKFSPIMIETMFKLFTVIGLTSLQKKNLQQQQDGNNNNNTQYILDPTPEVMREAIVNTLLNYKVFVPKGQDFVINSSHTNRLPSHTILNEVEIILKLYGILDRNTPQGRSFFNAYELNYDLLLSDHELQDAVAYAHDKDHRYKNDFGLPPTNRLVIHNKLYQKHYDNLTILDILSYIFHASGHYDLQYYNLQKYENVESQVTMISDMLRDQEELEAIMDDASRGSKISRASMSSPENVKRLHNLLADNTLLQLNHPYYAPEDELQYAQMSADGTKPNLFMQIPTTNKLCKKVSLQFFPLYKELTTSPTNNTILTHNNTMHLIHQESAALKNLRHDVLGEDMQDFLQIYKDNAQQFIHSEQAQIDKLKQQQQQNNINGNNHDDDHETSKYWSDGTKRRDVPLREITFNGKVIKNPVPKDLEDHYQFVAKFRKHYLSFWGDLLPNVVDDVFQNDSEKLRQQIEKETPGVSQRIPKKSGFFDVSERSSESTAPLNRFLYNKIFESLQAHYMLNGFDHAYYDIQSNCVEYGVHLENNINEIQQHLMYDAVHKYYLEELSNTNNNISTNLLANNDKNNKILPPKAKKRLTQAINNILQKVDEKNKNTTFVSIADKEQFEAQAERETLTTLSQISMQYEIQKAEDDYDKQMIEYEKQMVEFENNNNNNKKNKKPPQPPQKNQWIAKEAEIKNEQRLQGTYGIVKTLLNRHIQDRRHDVIHSLPRHLYAQYDSIVERLSPYIPEMMNGDALNRAQQPEDQPLWSAEENKNYKLLIQNAKNVLNVLTIDDLKLLNIISLLSHKQSLLTTMYFSTPFINPNPPAGKLITKEQLKEMLLPYFNINFDLQGSLYYLKTQVEAMDARFAASMKPPDDAGGNNNNNNNNTTTNDLFAQDGPRKLINNEIDVNFDVITLPQPFSPFYTSHKVYQKTLAAMNTPATEEQPQEQQQQQQNIEQEQQPTTSHILDDIPIPDDLLNTIITKQHQTTQASQRNDALPSYFKFFKLQQTDAFTSYPNIIHKTPPHHTLSTIFKHATTPLSTNVDNMTEHDLLAKKVYVEHLLSLPEMAIIPQNDEERAVMYRHIIEMAQQQHAEEQKHKKEMLLFNEEEQKVLQLEQQLATLEAKINTANKNEDGTYVDDIDALDGQDHTEEGETVFSPKIFKLLYENDDFVGMQEYLRAFGIDYDAMTNDDIQEILNFREIEEEIDGIAAEHSIDDFDDGEGDGDKHYQRGRKAVAYIEGHNVSEDVNDNDNDNTNKQKQQELTSPTQDELRAMFGHEDDLPPLHSKYFDHQNIVNRPEYDTIQQNDIDEFYLELQDYDPAETPELEQVRLLVRLRAKFGLSDLDDLNAFIYHAQNVETEDDLTILTKQFLYNLKNHGKQTSGDENNHNNQATINNEAQIVAQDAELVIDDDNIEGSNTNHNYNNNNTKLEYTETIQLEPQTITDAVVIDTPTYETTTQQTSTPSAATTTSNNTKPNENTTQQKQQQQQQQHQSHTETNPQHKQHLTARELTDKLEQFDTLSKNEQDEILSQLTPEQRQLFTKYKPAAGKDYNEIRNHHSFLTPQQFDRAKDLLTDILPRIVGDNDTAALKLVTEDDLKLIEVGFGQHDDVNVRETVKELLAETRMLKEQFEGTTSTTTQSNDHHVDIDFDKLLNRNNNNEAFTPPSDSPFKLDVIQKRVAKLTNALENDRNNNLSFHDRNILKNQLDEANIILGLASTPDGYQMFKSATHLRGSILDAQQRFESEENAGLSIQDIILKSQPPPPSQAETNKSNATTTQQQPTAALSREEITRQLTQQYNATKKEFTTATNPELLKKSLAHLDLALQETPPPTATTTSNTTQNDTKPSSYNEQGNDDDNNNDRDGEDIDNVRQNVPVYAEDDDVDFDAMTDDNEQGAEEETTNDAILKPNPSILPEQPLRNPKPTNPLKDDKNDV